jgi:predicted RNase H-like HicB family nuclease
MGIVEVVFGDRSMTYTFHVAITQERRFWYARCPALESYGAITAGDTREEALTHIYSALVMILEKLEDEETVIPSGQAFPGSIPITVGL